MNRNDRKCGRFLGLSKHTKMFEILTALLSINLINHIYLKTYRL